MKKTLYYILIAVMFCHSLMHATGVTLKSPNGGEKWMLESKRLITWNPVNPGNIRLVLFKGNVNLGMIASNIPESDGQFLWTVGIHSNGTAPPGDTFRILIRTMDGKYKDKSDGDFTLMPKIMIFTNIKMLKMVYPNGNETMETGGSAFITWNYFGYSGNIKLVLIQNSQKIGTIASGIPITAKQYEWNVGKVIGISNPCTGSGFKIRIKIIGKGIMDESDQLFTIKEGPIDLAP